MSETTLAEASNNDISYTSDGVVATPLVTHHRDVQGGVPHTIPFNKRHIIAVLPVEPGCNCGMTMREAFHEHSFTNGNLLSPDQGANLYRLQTHPRRRNPFYRY